MSTYCRVLQFQNKDANDKLDGMNLSQRHLPHFHSHRFDIKHLGALPSLATNRLLGFTAGSILMLFIPIFIYEFFGMNLQIFFIAYALIYAIRLPTFVWGAKLFTRTGLSVSMAIATLTWLIFYIGLYILDTSPNFFPYATFAITMLLLAIGNALYWGPFHVDFAQFSKKGRRGHQIGLLYAIQLVLAFAAPIVGGLLVSHYSYSTAFILALFTLALSFIPLAFVPNTHVAYEFGFFETFKKLFSKDYRYLTGSMAAAGAESVASTAVWPIFLFVVFKGDHLSVGIFAAVIVVVSVMLQLFVGKEVDKYKPRKLLPWGVDFNALGWIVKAFVSSIAGVFAASVIHRIGAIMMKTPMDTLMYEKAADAGHYIDEFTVIREIALTIGRTLFFVLMIFITMRASIQVAFILAAVVSFGINFFTRVHVVGQETHS